MFHKPDTGKQSRPDQHLTMSDSEFRDLAKRVHALTGIVLPQHKRPLAISRLSKRLHARGIENFSRYAVFLDTPQGAAEKNEMINAITTNLTSFFREQHHFDDMAQTLSDRPDNPNAARNRRHSDPMGAQRYRIWSAACSSGEEPYSIAMSVLNAGLVAPGVDLRILATDIDSATLETARQGIYPAEKIAACPFQYRQAFFEPIPGGKVRVARKARNLIDFRSLNLHEPWPMNGVFDTIFCRNVLIYFDTPAKQDIVARMISILRPGGTLYLGHSESLLGNHPGLEQQGRTTFRKRR